MNAGFGTLDWLIFGGYFVVLAISSYLLGREKLGSSRAFFTASNTMPMMAVALSVLATSQSAATFLGAPEYAYGGDLTFLGFYVSGFLAVLIVGYLLLPRFYAMRAVTVYELLQERYGQHAKRDAGIMFLMGRLLASGARLYIGSLAVSMILFGDIAFLHVSLSIVVLMAGALAYTYFGGVRSVIFSDVLQSLIYIGAGVAVAWYLYATLGLSASQMYETLAAENKLRVVDTAIDGTFSIVALLGGWLLLNIAAFGLDQDMTQRILSCRNVKEAQRSLTLSMLLTFPVAALFLFIGLELYLFYASAAPIQEFEGEKITIFMYYILHEMPDGLRGLVTVGAIAAALSSTNSVLGAMASVAIEDLYRPWREAKGQNDEAHFIKASRLAVLGFALALIVMAMASYYYQQYSDIGLLSFALGVMAFAYTGLLGVYGAALLTSRGSAQSVPLAFGAGFTSVLLLQPYLFGIDIGFAWQIVIGTAAAFGVMMLFKGD